MLKKLPDCNSSSVQDIYPFSKIKLIALDLDGTLLQSSNSNIPDRVLELGRSLKIAHRVSLTLATGRTLFGILPLLKYMPIKSKTPIIMYNGSIIVRNKTFEVLYRKTFSQAILREILEITAKYKVKTLAYFCHWFSGKMLNEYVMGWSNTIRPNIEHNGMTIDWRSSFDFIDDVDPSIAVIDTSEESLPIIKKLEKELSNISEVSISSGGLRYIEVKPNGVNKGMALEFISHALSLSLEEILALGDNDNDAEMLSLSGIGVAVQNASQKAKQSSDYICSFDAFSGAIQVMFIVREARKYFCQKK
jgi:hypothetical protein